MKRTQKEVQKAIKKEESERVKGRSSLNAIPPPKIEQIFAVVPAKTEEKVETVVNKDEHLRNELCSAYKFLVNYAFFEPNFEWLPMEVTSVPY
jgi:hypothetical protein